MAREDRYGLFAAFQFEVKSDAIASMHRVVEGLRGIETAVSQTDQAVRAAGLAREFQRVGQQSRAGVGGAADQFKKLRTQSTQARSGLHDIAAEFRALRAEARNIDFGDLDDPQMFRRASQEIDDYVAKLKRLEAQVDRSTPQGRMLGAEIQRSQTIGRNKVGMADQQRQAAIAQQRQGAAAGVAGAGAAVFLPLVGVGKEAIQITAGFNDQIQQIQAVSELSAQELQKVRDKAKQLGAQTRFSASEAASGFVLLAQAGYPVEKQIAAIDGTLNLAAAGNLDLAAATEITVSTLGQFQLGADQATHAANVLAKAAAMGQIDVTDIGMSLKYAGISAKRAGLGLEQTSSMLALLSEGGLKGEMAGTALGQMLDGLVAPASTGAAALKSLNVVTTNAQGKLLPYEQILGQTIEALGKVSNESERAALTNKIFGVVGGRAAGILMPRFNKLATTTATIVKQADQGIGAARKQASIMEDNIGGSFRNLSSAMEGAFIEIGEVLVPIVRAAADGLAQLLGMFIGLPKPVKTFVVLAGLAAAAIASLALVGGTASVAFFGLKAAMAEARIGMIAMQASSIPLTGFFGRAMGAFSGGGLVGGFQALAASVTGLGASLGGVATGFAAFLTGPVGLGIAAIALILAAIQFLNPQINLLGAIFSAIAAPIGFVFGLVKGVVQGIGDALAPIRKELAPVVSALNPVGIAMQYIGAAVQQAIASFQKFAGVGEGVGKIIGGAIGSVVTGPIVGLIRIIKVVIGVFSGAANLIRTAWQGFVDWFLAMPLVRFAVLLGEGLISALNCNPTLAIPLAWQGAIATIQGLMEGLLSFGRTVGSALSTLLDPGKLFQNLVSGLLERMQQLVAGIRESGIGNVFGGMLKGLDGVLGKLQGLAVPIAVEPVVKPQRQDSPAAPKGSGTLAKIQQAFVTAKQQAFAPEKLTPAPLATPMPLPAVKPPDLSRPTAEMVGGVARTATTKLGTAFDELTALWGDRWALLQRSGTTDLSGLFNPGVDTLHQILGGLQGDFGTFLGETAQAILQLDFARAKSAAQDFGGSLLGAIQQATGAMGSLILSTATFGIFSLASLSPMVLVVGGIVLGVAAIATNFLGIRTILVGLVRVIRGAVQIVYGVVEAIAAVVRMVVRVGQAVQHIRSGIVPALQGDFTQVRQGFGVLVGAVQVGASEIKGAITRSLGGAVKVFQGFGLVGRGVLTGLSQIIGGVGTAIRLAFQGGVGAVSLLSKTVQSLGQGFRSVLELAQRMIDGWRRMTQGIGAPLVANLEQLRSAPANVGAIADSIQARWVGAVQSINNQPVLREFVTFVQALPQVFATAIEKIQAGWNAMGNAVGGVLGRLRGKAKQTGQQLVGDLAENSPGPTYQIRAKWAVAVEQIESRLSGLVGSARTAGQRIAKGMSPDGVGALGSSVTSIGVALSNFAPAAAAPIFAVMDLVGAFQGIREAAPAVRAALLGNAAAAAVTTGSTATAAASQEVLTFATLKAAAAQRFATAQAKLTAVWNGIVAVTSAVLAGGFAGVATAATAAWTTVLAPILPIVAAIALVIGVVVLVRRAFQQNFGGIRDSVGAAFGQIRGAIAPIGQAFGEILTVLKPIGVVLLSAFLGPLRLAIGVIGIAFRLVGGIVKLLASGLVPIIQLIAVPFRIINSIVQGIVSFVQFLGQAIQSIGQTIWAGLPAPLRWMIENLQGGVSMMVGGAPPVQPQRFATGGPVVGPGGGDRIPALLQNREFVVTPEGAAGNLGLLRAINAGFPAEQVIRSLSTATPTGQYGALEGTSGALGIGSLPSPTMVSPPTLAPASPGDRPITIQVTVQQLIVNGTDQGSAQRAATQLQDEILTAMEDPRFQVAVRETLRGMVERMR